MSTSKKVGSGIPSLAGSNSCSSINSFLHIFCASFRGMGGEGGPTAIASVVTLLAGPGNISAKGVRGVRAINAALELALVLTKVLGAVKVGTPDSAVLCGILPTIGVGVELVDEALVVSIVLIDMHYIGPSANTAYCTQFAESLQPPSTITYAAV